MIYNLIHTILRYSMDRYIHNNIMHYQILKQKIEDLLFHYYGFLYVIQQILILMLVLKLIL